MKTSTCTKLILIMSLVTYSDSEDDTDETSNQVNKPGSKSTAHSTGPKRKRIDEDESQPRSKPPPLPSGFTTLYASTVRSSTSDDPALHSGRKRQIPHVEGNWPSFVYLEWLPSPKDLASLEDVIARIAEGHASISGSPSSKDEVQSSLRSELGVRLPLHVSLSAPLILTTDKKDVFKDTLVQAITTTNLTAFNTTPSTLRWVKNFDGSRHFLILTLAKPKADELQSLLSLCNRTATNFNLPQLYTRNGSGASGTDSTKFGIGISTKPELDVNNTTPKHTAPNHDNFHISIAWSLTPIRTTQDLVDQLTEKLKNMTITFETVYIKIGNVISNVPLRQ